ncbi:MAG TPA: PVC-type heme-binding CxxCH protein [Pirellulales bacterium]|jgi:putative membrane-bound dehydrogenase-like protein
MRVVLLALLISIVVVLNGTALAEPTGAPTPVAGGGTAQKPAPIDGPLSPPQALQSFAVAGQLRVELVASEPLVDSPVAIAFDEQGFLYVAENRGYPNGPPAGEPPLGRIARLADTDGDGRFDQRTDFATDLTFPNGVMPWRDGVIVTCAPEILFLRDTDGDGRADQRHVWFTGFSTAGSTQLRVSHPTLGVDNWIYVTSGLTGGNITCPAHPVRPLIKFGRSDFRFRPDLSEYESCDGGGQYGLCFDDAGRRFICYNRVPVQHVVLPSRYLRRNLHLAFSETVENCPTDLTPEPLAGHGQGARLFPISANVTTADSHAGTFTAACGVFVWRDGSLPALYAGGAFSCDPTGNLVHFDKLTPRGATFTAQPALAGREFLASTDNWFRPVFLTSGPDEALYICDMYRKTIEHPDYLPAEIRKRTDFDSGRGMGRIWRVVDAGLTRRDLSEKQRLVLRLVKGGASAVDLLKADGAWARDLGQRLLLAEDPTRQTMLLPVLTDEKLSDAGLIRVLRLLEARHKLDDATITHALADKSPAVREQALQLAEGRFVGSHALVDAIRPLAEDADPRVRFQWALTLGAAGDATMIPALAHLAVRDAEDRWLRAAVFSSIAGRERAFLHELLAEQSGDGQDIEQLCGELGRLLGASQPVEAWSAVLAQILDSKRTTTERAAIITGMADALRSRTASRGSSSVLTSVLSDDDTTSKRLREQLTALVDDAVVVATDTTSDSASRKTAIALLGHWDFPKVGDTLLALVDPAQPVEMQAAAVHALGGMQHEPISAALLSADRFAVYSPAVREEVLATMFSNKSHLPGLLQAIEAGAVPAGAVDSLRRKQLTEHSDPIIRERAAKMFGLNTATDRGRVYDDCKAALSLTPDVGNGRVVFKKHCANCHRLDREGFAVGPDLFGIRNQPKETILLHIVVPEHEITQGFAAYTVETKDGRTLTGLLASETPVSITLRQPLGKEETVLRSDIEILLASKLSLMPQEFEKAMNRQELADLLAYLKGESGPSTVGGIAGPQ